MRIARAALAASLCVLCAGPASFAGERPNTAPLAVLEFRSMLAPAEQIELNAKYVTDQIRTKVILTVPQIG